MARSPTRSQPAGATRGTRGLVRGLPGVGRGDVALAAVCVATLVGFLLRVRGLSQSLWNDEFLTLHHVVREDFTGMIDAVAAANDRGVETNPPLFFVLA